MLRIALCDDEKTFLDRLWTHVENYYVTKKEKACVERYEVPEQLITQYKQKVILYDLILLDIQMDTLNGIDTAKELRDAGYDGTIVFITSSKEYAIEGYQVNAYRYLVKPVSQTALSEVLEYAISEKEKREKTFVIKSEQEIFRIKQKDILYLEIYGHNLFIHLQDKVIKTRMPLRDFIRQDENIFAKVHKSYAVQLEHVSKYDVKSIYFMNGDTIPISRNYVSAFKDKLTAYWGTKLNG